MNQIDKGDDMQQAMKMMFIGWNENGEKCLQTLLDKSYRFEQLVVPTGYDTEPMKRLASQHDLPVYEYANDLTALKDLVEKIQPDVILVASFPKLLTADILALPKYGVINVHTGELPKYRGFHPLNWAIIRDEARIGVTVHYMDVGMDTGDVLAQGTVDMNHDDDIVSIKEKTTTLGAELLGGVVDDLVTRNAKLIGRQQRDSQALFAPKRGPADGRIKWTNTSRDIFNMVRALVDPYPNAFALDSQGQEVRLKKAVVYGDVGKVLAQVDGAYLISTGDGVILVKTDRQLAVGERLQ